eukprot:GDKJ01043973.1.p1 GENE.GDKJ01043973.1~~GDKJ01043973.1.p1  ORF type:complete len:560 (+),score=130.19 GDKJ01043973.1:12-1691(+)
MSVEVSTKLIIHLNVEDVLMFESDGPIGPYLNQLLSRLSWGTINSSNGDWEIISEIPSVHPPHNDTSLITYYDFIQRRLSVRRGTSAEETQWRIEADAKLASFTSKSNPGYTIKSVFDAWVKNLCLPMPVRKVFEIEKPNTDVTLPVDLKAYEGADLKQKAQWAAIDEANYELFSHHGFYRINGAVWNLIMSLTREKKDFKLVFHSFNDRKRVIPNHLRNRLDEFLREWDLFVETKHAAFNGSNRTKPAKFNGEKGTRNLRISPQNIATVQMSATTLPASENAHPDDDRRVFSVSLSGAGVRTPFLPQEGEPLAGQLVVPGTEAGAKLESLEDAGPKSASSVKEISGVSNCYVALTRALLQDNKSNAVLLIHAEDDTSSETLEENDLSSLLLPPTPLIVNPNVDGFHNVVIVSEKAEIPTLISSIDGSVLDLKTYQNETIVRIPQWKLAGDADVMLHGVFEALEAKQRRIAEDIRNSVEETVRKEKQKIEESVVLSPQEYLLQTVLPALQPAIDEVLDERPSDPITVIAFRLLEYADALKKNAREEGKSNGYEGTKLLV